MNPPPICPRCNSNTQVWTNQLSGKLMCHRIRCHVEIPEPLTPEQEDFAAGLIKLGEETQGIRHTEWWKVPINVDLPPQQPKPTPEQAAFINSREYYKPSILARLFSRVGQKRRGWSGRAHD